MKCYNCGTELIWGGDHDCEDHEDHAIVTNLSCPECDAFHLVYWGHKGEEESKQLWIEGYKEWLDKKELLSFAPHQLHSSPLPISISLFSTSQ